MESKNYPIYIKTGLMNKKVIGNILVREKMIKTGFNYDSYEVNYVHAQIDGFFKRIFIKSFIKDGTIKLSDKAIDKIIKETKNE